MSRSLAQDGAAFWAWFSAHADRFGPQFENQRLIDELDRRVEALGPFGWELGPGQEKPNALVLSPGGERALLQVTRKLVALAPPLPAWEFHPARPPKCWDLRFEVQLDDGALLPLDAAGWRCRTWRDPDGTRVIAVDGEALRALDAHRAQDAAEIALDGILGEAVRLERYDVVLVEPIAPGTGQPLRSLR